MPIPENFTVDGGGSLKPHVLKLAKGLYRHYRNGDYRVIGVATNHDTQEKTVIYHPEHDPDMLWSRPIDEFTAIVNLVDENRSVDRFTYLSE